MQLEGEKAKCVESKACDQTVTLRYRVSLEGFVNVAQLQWSREAHWASFSPPAVRVYVCVCVYMYMCGRGFSVFGYKRHIHTVWLLKLYSCSVCECVFCM